MHNRRSAAPDRRGSHFCKFRQTGQPGRGAAAGSGGKDHNNLFIINTPYLSGSLRRKRRLSPVSWDHSEPQPLPIPSPLCRAAFWQRVAGNTLPHGHPGSSAAVRELHPAFVRGEYLPTNRAGALGDAVWC